MKNLAVISVLLLLGACASTPKVASSPAPEPKIASEPSEKPTPAPVSSQPTVSNADLDAKRLAAERLAAEKLAAEVSALQKQSVYFDFDKYEIKPEYQAILQKQATFLQAHTNDVVTIEGNADERGSEEYNLALGDKRANSSRKVLELLGVPANQINAVSLGEEKPRLACHEEKCWQENRRDDFVHKLN